MTEENKHLGNMAVKITAQDEKTVTVAGWGVVFGGIDLEGDTFTKDTDYQLDLVPVKPVFYDHTLGAVKSSLGVVRNASEKSEDGIDGLWIEAELHKSQSYVNEVITLIESGVLGWSSGSIGHLVRRDNKSIKSWPVVEWSLTATPAEPRTIGAQLYKAIAELNEGLQALEQEAGDASDSATNEIEPTDIETEKIESAKAQTEVHKQMDEEKKVEETAEVKTPEIKIDYDLIIKGVADVMKESAPVKKAPAVLKIPHLSKDPETNAFLYWLKTGKDAGPYKGNDESKSEEAVKAALQEGSATEGGYLVPDDFLGRIIAKRDEMSVARAAGAQVFQTSSDVLQVPNENATSSFTIAAEEGSYSESEPTFGQVSLTIYKPTNLIKVSEELMADEKANLEGFLSGMLGRAAAAWENDMFLTGSGSSQPQGIFVGGTAALTTDFATTLGYGEIPELYYKLPEPYADGSEVWVTRNATLGLIMGLAGDNFQFMPTPAGGLAPNIMGKRVFVSDQVDAIASGKKVMAIANMTFYGIAERQGMLIRRNPYLYMASGQIGLFSNFRVGGAVLQAEAFQYATTA